MVEVEWKGKKFVLYREDGDFYVEYNGDKYKLRTEAETLDEAVDSFIKLMDKKFSYTYRGWRRMINDWNIITALGNHKGYDYYNPRAEYIILHGVKRSHIVYIDDDYTVTAKLINPFRDVDIANRIIKTMKDIMNIIENVYVTQYYTKYEVLGKNTLLMGVAKNGIYALLNNEPIDPSAEEIITKTFGSVM